MSIAEKSVRQSVSLPARVARRVKSLAQTSKTSTSRVIADLIESGLDAREQEKKRFFEFADRLSRSRDPAEQKRLKEVMPKVQWTGLPPALRDHLFERLRERKITAEDLYQLKAWRESEPEAPDGPWYKDFGSFKICGEGQYPKTFLLRGQPAKGEEL